MTDTNKTDKAADGGLSSHELVRLCELHEDLGKLQPRLQFKHPLLGWIESGVITARVSESTLGQYREILLPNKENTHP